MSVGIIDLPQWLATPAGRALCAWETSAYEQAVANLFGYHALQLGLPQIDTLRANRMPHRWLACAQGCPEPVPAPATAPAMTPTNVASSVLPTAQAAPALLTHFAALPFAANSLDLVTLPHALDGHAHPHATLREVARVLLPEGRVVVSGFNPSGLWGLRHRRDRLVRLWRRTNGFLPPEVSPISVARLRDWLHLLDFDMQVEHYGCYQPAWTNERWLARVQWMDRLGPQSWPVFGSVYLIVAVKRVHGVHRLGASWKTSPRRGTVGLPVTRCQEPNRRQATAPGRPS